MKFTRYKKRFEWIYKFYQVYLNLVAVSLGINGKSIRKLQRELMKKQISKIKNYSFQNTPTLSPSMIYWFNYLYALEKQIWASKKYNQVLEIGNSILLFYCLEIAATILIGKNPEKEVLSHRQIRKLLIKELDRLGWHNLIFPFSLRRYYQKWEGLSRNNANLIPAMKFMTQCCFGREGREFKEMFKHWECKRTNKIKHLKKKMIEKNFFIYFYDLFYKYSESFRYRPIVPTFRSEDIKGFNYSTRALVSLILTFFEILILTKYPKNMKQLLIENLRYKQKYLPSQVERWKEYLNNYEIFRNQAQN